MEQPISELLSASGIKIYTLINMLTGEPAIHYLYDKELLDKHLCLYFYQYTSPADEPREEYESVIGVFGFDEVSTFDINLFYDTMMDLGAESMHINIMNIVAFIKKGEASTLPFSLANISTGETPKKIFQYVLDDFGLDLFHNKHFGEVLLLHGDQNIAEAYAKTISLVHST